MISVLSLFWPSSMKLWLLLQRKKMTIDNENILNEMQIQYDLEKIIGKVYITVGKSSFDDYYLFLYFRTPGCGAPQLIDKIEYQMLFAEHKFGPFTKLQFKKLADKIHQHAEKIEDDEVVDSFNKILDLRNNK